MRRSARHAIWSKVIFHDVAPGNHYVAGRPAPADQIWIRADIRGGRTDEQKSRMLRRIMQDVGRASGAPRTRFGSTCVDIPGTRIRHQNVDVVFRFAHDSPLEEAVSSDLAREAEVANAA